METKVLQPVEKILKAVAYFDEHVGHFTDSEKVIKIQEEVDELYHSVKCEMPDDVINECSDVATIAYHVAVRNGFKGTPDELFLMAYDKMKRRIESGERDYKNRDF